MESFKGGHSEGDRGRCGIPERTTSPQALGDKGNDTGYGSKKKVETSKYKKGQTGIQEIK